MNQTERENTGALSAIVKVNLFRGAFCLLLFGVCAIPVALAQRQAPALPPSPAPASPEGTNHDVIGYDLVSAVVTTNPATNITSSSATLNGTVNPSGLTTSVHFEYGTTTNYGSTTPSHSYTGNTAQSVNANVTGLSTHTTYHFRIVATNNGGTSFGSDRTFTTLSATGPPVVITSPATSIASFSARLNGSLDPHGLTTTVYFQYGTTTSYGSTTPMQSHTGNTYLNISGNISGLMASHIYHFRIVAHNNSGTSFGSDTTFTTLSVTGPPVVTTNPATNVTSSLATLNGSLDPHGLTTSVHFQYGTTTSYGHTTAMQTETGNTFRNIGANISGLTPHTTYHFRIAATNSAGARYGSDRTFSTSPIIVTNTNDSGPGSLREALLTANNTPGTDTITITFAQAIAGQSIFPRHNMSILRDGITLQGFVDNTHQPAVTIDASQLTDPFVLLDTASNVSVRFLRFVNIQESTGFVFINVNVQPSSLHTGNITIQGDVFSNPPGLTTKGIAVYLNMFPGTSGAVVSNITITDNSFTHFEGDSNGILIEAGETNNTIQDTLIAGNTFSDTTFGVELVAANANGSRIIRSKIMGNSFATNSQAVNVNHIGTDGQPPTTGNLIDDTLIDGNRFTDNHHGPAIALLGGMTNAIGNTISNTQIVNNTITGSTQFGGIGVVGGRAGGTQNAIQGVTFVNDTIANNGGVAGIGVNPNIGTSGNTVSGVSVSNTILWGNANGDFDGVDPSQVQYSITAQSGYFGINHNFNADPLFVNPAANDFHLQSGSPARHAGTSNGAPTIDLDCQPRGSPPSIGAYEFDGPNICTW